MQIKGNIKIIVKIGGELLWQHKIQDICIFLEPNFAQVAFQ
jgi:hypothetical protein